MITTVLCHTVEEKIVHSNFIMLQNFLNLKYLVIRFNHGFLRKVIKNNTEKKTFKKNLG